MKIHGSMYRVVLFPVLLLGMSMFAQEAKKPADTDKPNMTLSGDEKFTVRTDEADILKAKAEVQAAQEHFNNASGKLNQDLVQLYERHHIKQNEVVLCDGPGQGPCAPVGIGDFSLQPVPKPETKKAEDAKAKP
jgi:hypothetical protein